jgi:hypothetical protein
MSKLLELANALAEMGHHGQPTIIRPDLFKLLTAIVAEACELEAGGAAGTGEDVDVGAVQHARSVRTTMCYNPNCNRPHLVLYNAAGAPFAVAVLPAATLAELQEWEKRH